jgi:RNA polymerase sigma-70 factor (ECF subfamily)
MSEDREIELVRQFQEGDDRDESFRRIYERFYSQINRFFRWNGFSDDESSDLTQECFFRIYQTLPTFRHESRFATWVLQVARHVCLNEIRRRNAQKRSSLTHSLDTEVDGLGAPEPSPESEVIWNEQRVKLRSALQDLPDQMRSCCILRYEQSLKYEEIAIVMKISIETVKAQLYQARKRLGDMLGEIE